MIEDPESTQGSEEKCQELLAAAEEKLLLRKNEAVPWLIEVFKGEQERIFSERADKWIQGREAEVLTEVLTIFATDNCSLRRREKNLKEASGQTVTSDLRMTRGGNRYLVIQSNGQVSKVKPLEPFLSRSGIESPKTDIIQEFLSQGKGRHILIINDRGTPIFGARRETDKVLISIPPLAEAYSFPHPDSAQAMNLISELTQAPRQFTYEPKV